MKFDMWHALVAQAHTFVGIMGELKMHFHNAPIIASSSDIQT